MNYFLQVREFIFFTLRKSLQRYPSFLRKHTHHKLFFNCPSLSIFFQFHYNRIKKLKCLFWKRCFCNITLTPFNHGFNSLNCNYNLSFPLPSNCRFNHNLPGFLFIRRFNLHHLKVFPKLQISCQKPLIITPCCNSNYFQLPLFKISLKHIRKIKSFHRRIGKPM